MRVAVKMTLRSLTRLIPLLVPLLCSVGAGRALAAEPATLQFKLCSEDQPALPLSHPDPATPGSSQILLAMAAEQTGARISHISAPWYRCQQMLDAGSVDAINIASYAAINRSIAAFPMLDAEQVDASKSLGRLRTELFRRSGSPVQVIDGQFINLKTPVGILHSYQANSLSVARHGGTVDDNSRSLESLAQRLTTGRLDLIAGSGESLRRLCANQYAGKMEVLATALDEAHLYLAFSKPFYGQHRDAVEAFWSAIQQISISTDYLDRIAAAATARKQKHPSGECPVAR